MARCVSELVKVAQAAIAACDGERLVSAALQATSTRWEKVWAAGKAAAAMARPFAGANEPLVIDTRVAGHPLPDAHSVAAGERLLAAAGALLPTERALLLLSGGASSLLAAPIEGLRLEELQEAIRTLYRGGAPIADLNLVRRHLTRLGGGKLLRACPGHLEVWALSDVIGDDPAIIGSGPASPESRFRAAALEVARRYRVPEVVLQVLATAAENPGPDDPIFGRSHYRLLASPSTLRDEAATAARAAGLVPRLRAALVTGEVEELAVELMAEGAGLRHGEVLVAVGEPTVQVRGEGTGGRAQHLALSLVAPLSGRDLALVALGSDGRDGPTPAAGAAVDGRTLSRLARQGIDAAEALARSDSHRALAQVAAIIPGWTATTNLTDLYLLGRG